MGSSVGESGNSEEEGRSFTTTIWSLVLRAGDTQNPESRFSLEILCRRYWYPVYSYIRFRGYDRETAQDLTQGFFTQLLEKRSLKVADPQRGRFRSFLLTSVKHFLADSWDRRQALKRGGGQSLIPMDFSEAENRKYEPAEEVNPETVYERRWASAVTSEVLKRLRDEAAHKGSLERYERLQGFLTGELEGTSQNQIAAELGMSVEAVRVAVHRLRKRFGKLLRKQIAETVADPHQIDDEIRYLLSILSL